MLKNWISFFLITDQVRSCDKKGEVRLWLIDHVCWKTKCTLSEWKVIELFLVWWVGKHTRPLTTHNPHSRAEQIKNKNDMRKRKKISSQTPTTHNPWPTLFMQFDAISTQKIRSAAHNKTITLALKAIQATCKITIKITIKTSRLAGRKLT